MPSDRELFQSAIDISDATGRENYLAAHAPSLDQHARVARLLSAHVAAGGFLEPATSAFEGTASSPPHDDSGSTADFPGKDERIGALIAGKYKLIEAVGEGGMGSVYMAQQTEPVKRAVAVKVIKAGMDSRAVLARFEAERQALAMMDHPNIARVLDAGTTESGRPFFVMELVKGVPITQYCDDKKLTPRQRLELFVPVCNAIQHAHQKGIIHRDIKPSNVLVALYDDHPVPKVIDFGVAKAAGQSLTDKTLMTGFGAVVGTPEYMSPEQANLNNLDIDTRSDVYSLGVLLYELLTGSTPVDRKSLGKAALLEILRIVREVEAPRPSAKLSTIDTLPSVAANRGTEPAKLSKLMKGELDWVVLKALEKDRTRRYESANGLARDIQRYLADEIVEARPPSAGYRLKKFVRRHKGRVIAASLIFFALLAGIAGTTAGLFEARHQERRALAELSKKEAARKKMREALDTLTSNALEEWFTRERDLSASQKEVLRKLLDQYAEFAEEAGEDLDTRKGQVRALQRVGRIQLALGDRPAAKQSLERAASLAGTADNPISADTEGWELVAFTYTTLFTFYHDNRRYREAEPFEREAQAARLQLRKADPARRGYRFLIAIGHTNLAAALMDQNRLDDAEVETRAAVGELEALIREFPKEMGYFELLATVLNNRAIAAKKRLRFEEALAVNARVIEMRRKHVLTAPMEVVPEEGLVRSLDMKAELLSDAGRLPEVESVFREAIRILMKLHDSFPAKPLYRVWLAREYTSLSDSFRIQGRNQPAIDEAKRAITVARSVAADYDDDHLPPGVALANALLAMSLALGNIQNYTEAESTARSAIVEIDRLIRTFGQRYELQTTRVRALDRLSSALSSQAKFSEMVATERERIVVLADLARENPELNWRSELTRARCGLAASLISSRKFEDAETELRAAGGDLEKLPLAELDLMRSIYYFNRLKLTVGSGRWLEGAEWGDRAVESSENFRIKNPSTKISSGLLVQCHWHRATARERLRRYRDAAEDWTAASELADVPMDQAFYRAHSGAAFHLDGDDKRAAMAYAGAIQLAESALKVDKLPGITFYDGAGVYALAAAGTADRTQADRYATEAVRLLELAKKTGFLNDPAQLAALRVAGEYQSLHGRTDFAKLLAELEKIK